MTIILLIIITVILITILTITIIIMTIIEKIKDAMAEVVPEVTRDSFKLNAETGVHPVLMVLQTTGA